MMSFDYLLGRLDWQQTISAFIVLFAVLDVFGSTPIIIDLKQKGRPVNAMQATLISSCLLVGFFFAGDILLRLFSRRYRILCRGRCAGHLPDGSRNDSRH